jgi:hypothetical protein
MRSLNRVNKAHKYTYEITEKFEINKMVFVDKKFSTKFKKKQIVFCYFSDNT